MKFEIYNEVLMIKAKYFQYLDLKQWQLMDEVFSEDATFEGFAFGEQNGREAFVATLADFLNNVKSQHAGFIPQMRQLEDRKVRAIWSMHDELYWPVNSKVYKGVEIPNMHGLRGWGFYEDEYELRPEGWRMTFSRLTRTRIDALTQTEPVMPQYDVVQPDIKWLNG